MQDPVVLHEDNHLLVINKPAGMPTMGVTDRLSVYQWAGGYIKRRYQKPGNVFVGIVSRLDTLTSGVLVLARTSKGAARLSEQIRQGTMSKNYLALVEGQVEPSAGTIRSSLYKDDARHRMRVDVRGTHHDSQEAVMHYSFLQRLEVGSRAMSLLRVELKTGRKHQIRVQMSSLGHPVVGDSKYGATTHLIGSGIGLHAFALKFQHPTREERLEFQVKPPVEWPVELILP